MSYFEGAQMSKEFEGFLHRATNLWRVTNSLLVVPSVLQSGGYPLYSDV